MRWSINSFLEVSCGYGERLWAPIIYSVLTIVNFSLIYPLVGGFSNTESHYGISSLPDLGLSKLLIESLYFSTVTFTTLGYGDYQPAEISSKLVAGLESFIGTFLIALLIFTIGRKMSK